MTRIALPRRQAGLTLVELMISMAIGMIIVLAVITAFISASRAARVAEATGRMNEDAQAALTILTQQLRMAGANPAQPDRNTTTLHNVLANPFSIRGCDDTFSNITTATSTAALTCPTSTGNSSISVGYEANRFNTVPTSGGTPTDCLGNSLPPTSSVSPQAVTTSLGVAATVTVYEAENRFYVTTTTSSFGTLTSLACKGNSPSSSPTMVVENIEAMRITYGVSNPARARDFGANSPDIAPNFILGYLSSTDLINNTSTLSGTLTFTAPSVTTTLLTFSPTFNLKQLDSAATFLTSIPGVTPTSVALPVALSRARVWGAVKAVRVCVLVRSDEFPFDKPTQYIDCEGVLRPDPLPTNRNSEAYKEALRLRRAYTATVVLRNQSP